MYIKTILALTALCALLSGCGKDEKKTALQVDTKVKDQLSSDKKTAKPLPPPSAEEITAAVDAAFDGDLATVTAALENGVPVDQTDQYGNTLLMLAAFNGHIDLTKTLLDAEADISVRDTEGRTALMFASTGPFPDVVRLLVKNGAEINAVDNVEHFSPVMFAAAEGLSPVVDILIEAGADLTLKDIDGDTAADFARQRGFTALADKLQKLIDEKETK